MVSGHLARLERGEQFGQVRLCEAPGGFSFNVDPARNTSRLTPVAHHRWTPYTDLHHVTGHQPVQRASPFNR
jgi:hypothetical protein